MEHEGPQGYNSRFKEYDALIASAVRFLRMNGLFGIQPTSRSPLARRVLNGEVYNIMLVREADLRGEGRPILMQVTASKRSKDRRLDLREWNIGLGSPDVPSPHAGIISYKKVDYYSFLDRKIKEFGYYDNMDPQVSLLPAVRRFSRNAQEVDPIDEAQSLLISLKESKSYKQNNLWIKERQSFFGLYGIRIDDNVAGQIVDQMGRRKRHQAELDRNLHGERFRAFVLNGIPEIILN